MTSDIPPKAHVDDDDAGHAHGYGHRGESVPERADRNFDDILQELRVVLSGTQLISGFLLAVAFQSRFPDLDADEVVHYLVLVGLAGLATLLGLTPVVVHRLHFGKRMKDRVVVVGNRLLVATLVVVSVLMIGVASFIFEVVISETAGLWAAGVAVVVCAALWVVAASTRRANGDDERPRSGTSRSRAVDDDHGAAASTEDPRPLTTR